MNIKQEAGAWGRRIPRLSAGWTCVGVALVIWLLVHRDYGITWDESVQSTYGEAVRLVLTGGQSFADFSHSAGTSRGAIRTNRISGH
jgi:ferric-dicitrate binding protein FerR (iron transport regulator)